MAFIRKQERERERESVSWRRERERERGSIRDRSVTVIVARGFDVLTPGDYGAQLLGSVEGGWRLR